MPLTEGQILWTPPADIRERSELGRYLAWLRAERGLDFREYDLAEFGPRSPVRFQPKNSDGWFRVDLRKGWIERAEVLFIKPKT